MPVSTLEPLFDELWLHERPRVTDRKGNPTWRTSRKDALTFPYIEPNITGIMQSFIIIDRDLPDADRIAGRLGLPEPSWASINPHTTQGHISYNLVSPVCLTEAAHRRPVNLLARVEHGLATVLEGDPGFTGGLTKNPFHPQHPTLWGDKGARYELKYLAKSLDELGALPSTRNPRKNVQRSAVGRNVALFDDTRAWGYTAVERFWGARPSQWHQAVLAQAWEYNETRIGNDFTSGPLSYTEVGYVAKSVSVWIWKRFTPATRAAYKARRRADGREGGLIGGRAGGIASGQSRRKGLELL